MTQHQRNDRPGGSYDDREVVDYLLDRLPTADREQFEDRMMADPALFELTEATEEELLLRYAQGTVDPNERAAIEQAYSEPPRSDRLAEARAVSRAIDRAMPPPPVQQPWWKRLWGTSGAGSRLALIGAAAAAMVFVVFISTQRSGPVPGKEMPVAIWVVPGGRLRGSESGKEAIFRPTTAGVVRMKLPGTACTADGPCRLVITNIDNGNIGWSGVLLRTDAEDWSADIPGNSLPPGDYLGEVTASSGARSSHQFRVQ